MPEKILVVDDETDLELLIRQKFRKQIRNNEFEFVFAYNGLEALAKLLEHPDVCLVLSDINMPEMDGLTLLARLNELRNPALKTVIVSAYGDMDNIRTAMNRGAFDFITKPVDFNDLEITIKKTIDELDLLRKAKHEHEQLIAIQRDLNTARIIQQSIVPQVFPPFPDYKQFDIFGSMTAAKEVGGDFFDFFLIDKHRVGFVIGDVSGKGIPAAIFMAVSRTFIRATGMKGMAPTDCMNYVNNLLCNESVDSMFVTVFYGILDIPDAEINYVNAGHNAPVVIKKDGTREFLEATDGIIVGAIDEFTYKSKTLKFEPGDALFMYTDGVTEAFNDKSELYSDPRLIETLVGTNELDPRGIVNTVVEDVRKYSEGVPQSDDITALAIKFYGH